MKQTGIRTYEVKAADFPIAVVIRAKDLDENNAFASDVQVVKDAAVVEKIAVTLADVPPRSKRYNIRKPSASPKCDLTQTITGFFGKNAPDNASYVITMTSVTGDEFKTTIRVPTIDPGIANLTFQYR